MSTRNKLLESIVLALGGTVTNPNNRNQLLYDWLAALGGAPPVTRLAPNFNGVSQYADTGHRLIDVDNLNGLSLQFATGESNGTILSQGAVDSGVDREFHMFYSGGILSAVLGGTTVTILSSAESPVGVGLYDITFDTSSLDVKFNGSLIATKPYSVGPARNATNNNTLIGARYSSVVTPAFLKLGQIYNLKINDGSVYNYPMDDGWANNPVMRNTGTGADGTFVNMTEAAWAEVPA